MSRYDKVILTENTKTGERTWEGPYSDSSWSILDERVEGALNATDVTTVWIGKITHLMDKPPTPKLRKRKLDSWGSPKTAWAKGDILATAAVVVIAASVVLGMAYLAATT